MLWLHSLNEFLYLDNCHGLPAPGSFFLCEFWEPVMLWYSLGLFVLWFISSPCLDYSMCDTLRVLPWKSWHVIKQLCMFFIKSFMNNAFFVCLQYVFSKLVLQIFRLFLIIICAVTWLFYGICIFLLVNTILTLFWDYKCNFLHIPELLPTCTSERHCFSKVLFLLMSKICQNTSLTFLPFNLIHFNSFLSFLLFSVLCTNQLSIL